MSKPSAAVVPPKPAPKPPVTVPPKPVTTPSKPPAVVLPKPPVIIPGLKRVLLVGINYKDTPYELYGCINDVNNMSAQLKQFFPKCTDHRIITDDTVMKPTKDSIMSSINWLVAGLKPGENIVFHYSGHGGLVRDKNGDEVSGYDSCIYPINADIMEMITDDELRANLAAKLPQGCKCFVILDSCHSGTAVDLRCMWEAPSPTSLTYNENKNYAKTNGTILFLSGCQDADYSADTVDKNGRPSGAMTMALLDTWKTYGPAIKFKHLLWDVRQYLKSNGYTQVPQISTGNYIDPNSIFDLGK